jgi:PIN domain-containing protein
MTSIADAVNDLAGTPRPVVCLDTCIFLDILRSVRRDNTQILEHTQKILQTIATAPDRLQIVITSLIRIEWMQKHSDVLNKETRQDLSDLDKRISTVHATWDSLGSPLPNRAPKYHDPSLPENLKSLAESLLSIAMELDEDPDCIRRALDRVKTKTRPSQGGAIKDSIHLEHFLELSRRLAARGFTEPRVFVSSNTSDFSLDSSKAGILHPDLVGDLSTAGLEFFPSLGPALRHVGLFGTRPAPAGGVPPAPPAGAPPTAP